MHTIYEHNCIACGKPSFKFHSETHRAESNAYFWVCNECGAQVEIQFADDGKTSTQRTTGRRCDRTLALFEVVGFPRMRFLYQGVSWDGCLDHDYFYHEHTCPTNLLRCEEIFIDGKSDPHGAFRCIKEVLITGPSSIPRDEALEMLCGLARTHVTEESNASDHRADAQGESK
jgi:hypothetical protein